MEATVLRAALSAAIRVTVSTSLLGCGGVTTGGGSGDGSVGSESPSKNSQGQGVSAPGSGYPSGNGNAYGYGSAGYPASSGPSVGTAGTSPVAMTGGSGGALTGQAGAALAGAPAGEEPGAGGVPGSAWDCAAAKACLADLEQLVSEVGQPLPANPEAVACCQLLILESVQLTSLGPECATELGAWNHPMHWPCCQILDYPQGTACTPWGPPVPPELELEQLLAWEAAA